jgi:hypothetical protein
MEGFTYIDGIVAAVIVLSAILAYSRGLVRESLAIAGWVGAAVLAFVFAARAEPLIKELPVVGPFLSESCELSIIAAFAAVFALGLVVMSLFTPLFSSAAVAICSMDDFNSSIALTLSCAFSKIVAATPAITSLICCCFASVLCRLLSTPVVANSCAGAIAVFLINAITKSFYMLSLKLHKALELF